MSIYLPTPRKWEGGHVCMNSFQVGDKAVDDQKSKLLRTKTFVTEIFYFC